ALPPLRPDERAIRIVEKDQAIGRARGAGHLRKPDGRIEPSPRPRFSRETVVVIVEHPLVVEMLDAVGPRDDRRALEQPGAPQRANPQSFGAGDVDDVVHASIAKRAPHRSQRRDGLDGPAQQTMLRTRTEVVRKQHVALVSERAELFLQLEEHLGRSQPRIARIVADKENAQSRQAVPRTSSSSLRWRAVDIRDATAEAG